MYSSNVQALRLSSGSSVRMGSWGMVVLLPDHGTRSSWGIIVTPQPLFMPGKDPVPILLEAGWAPWPVWTCAVNLPPTRFRSPDSPTPISVAIPTELPGPQNEGFLIIKVHTVWYLLKWDLKFVKQSNELRNIRKLVFHRTKLYMYIYIYNVV